MPDERRLAAIMLTSIDGFGRLVQRDERLAFQWLEVQREILRTAFAAHRGREVKAMGDRFLVEFPTAADAIGCALDAQRALHERYLDEPPDQRPRLRVGLHLGDVEARGGDLFGDGVNIASRIEPLAEPGGICVSQPIYDQIAGRCAVPLEGLGPQELRNIRLRVPVYRALLPWTAAEPKETGARKRIAVLPLQNISPAAGDAYLADGMTEELIHTLSRLPALRIIAPTSVMRYKERPTSVRDVGRELGVDAVIEGSVRKAGEMLRVTIQLVDARSEEPIWSRAFDRSMKDVLDVQMDIARRVAEALRVPSPTEEPPDDLGAVRNLAAYTWYLKGRHQLAASSRIGRDQAIDCFRRALDADPRYALAHAGIADAYLLHMDSSDLPLATAYERGRAAAKRALAIDERCVEAQTSLAMIEAVYDQNAEKAEARLRRAIELNPDYGPAHHWYAVVLSALGQEKEALEHSRIALETDPTSPMAHLGVARMQREAGDLPAALAAYEEALRLDPAFGPALLGRSSTLHLSWDWIAAASTAIAALDSAEDPFPFRLLLMTIFLQAGHADEAARQLDRAMALHPRSPALHLAEATLRFFTRRFAEASDACRRALKESPNRRDAFLLQAIALGHTGELGEALAALTDAESIAGPTNLDRIAAVRAELLAVCGREDEARAMLPKLARSNRKRSIAREIAAVHAHLRDTDKAIAQLAWAAERHTPSSLWLNLDPAWDSIRDRADFRSIVVRVGLEPPPSLPRET